MKSMLSKLLGLELKLVDLIKSDYEAIIKASVSENVESGFFGNYTYKHPALGLAHLYTFDNESNPYFGDSNIAEMAVALCDKWSELALEGQKKGETISTSEWPVFATAEIYEMLYPLLSDETKDKWKNFVTTYNDLVMHKPFGLTSPNHDAWRIAALYRGGQVFDRSDWQNCALFLAKQMVELQTVEGFWEEGLHHGPSMRYNSVTLAGLTITYYHSKADFLINPIKKLAKFMTTYVFPDGISIGAFDGRQSSSLAFYTPIVPGLEFIPEGKVLNARGIDLWYQAKANENLQNAVNSKWYLYFGTFFLSVASKYYLSLLDEKEGEESFSDSDDLLVDSDGTIENHTATFDGLIYKRGSWAVGLSSQNSDVPFQSSSIYRLDRESRIEIWHKKAKTIIGGGHNVRNADVPKANIILDTGYAGGTNLGEVKPQEENKRRRYYQPMKTFSTVKNGTPILKSIFAHGTVFTKLITIDESQIEVSFEWETLSIDRLTFQLPMVAWRDAKIFIGDLALTKSNDFIQLNKELHIQGGIFDSHISLKVPELNNMKTVLRPFLKPLVMYHGNFKTEEQIISPFTVNLITSEILNPEAKGNIVYNIKIK